MDKDKMLNGVRRAQELPAVNGQGNGKSNGNSEEPGASKEGCNSGGVEGGGETEIAGLRQPPIVSFTQVTSTSTLSLVENTT